MLQNGMKAESVFALSFYTLLSLSFPISLFLCHSLSLLSLTPRLSLSPFFLSLLPTFALLFSLSLSLSLCLSFTHSLTRTHTLTNIHAHTHSLPLSLNEMKDSDIPTSLKIGPPHIFLGEDKLVLSIINMFIG